MMSQQSLPSRALRVMLELSPTAQIFQTLKCASKSLHQLGVAAAAIEQQLTPVAEWSAKIAGGDAVIHVYGYGLESNPADLGMSSLPTTSMWSLAAMTARRGFGRALVPPWTPGTIQR